MAELILTKENFAASIAATQGPVLVDFWATWCGPCRMLAPELEKLAQAHPELTIGKVNVDEQPELSIEYGVSSIPMLVLFRGGQPVAKTIGYQTAAELEGFLQP